MKLIKRASRSYSLILNKSDWTKIGLAANWLKLAVLIPHVCPWCHMEFDKEQDGREPQNRVDKNLTSDMICAVCQARELEKIGIPYDKILSSLEEQMKKETRPLCLKRFEDAIRDVKEKMKK